MAGVTVRPDLATPELPKAAICLTRVFERIPPAAFAQKKPPGYVLLEQRQIV